MELGNYQLFGQDYLLPTSASNGGKDNICNQLNQTAPASISNVTTASNDGGGGLVRNAFVNLYDIAANQCLKGQACITAHIQEPKSTTRHSRRGKSRSKKNGVKQMRASSTSSTRRGIGSLQSFNFTSDSWNTIQNIMDKQRTLPDHHIIKHCSPQVSSTGRVPQHHHHHHHHQHGTHFGHSYKQTGAPSATMSRLVRLVDRSSEKENLPSRFFSSSVKRGRFRPTILKGRGRGKMGGDKASKSLSLQHHQKCNNSPIKNLTFSPSRFFNTSTLNSTTDEKQALSSSADVTKELSFDIEDSGIGGNSEEMVCEPIPFPPSLTSTPISSRRHHSNAAKEPPASTTAVGAGAAAAASDKLPFMELNNTTPNTDCDELKWLLDSTVSLSGAREDDATTAGGEGAGDHHSLGNYLFLDSEDCEKTFCDIPTFPFNSDDFSSFDPDDLDSINLYPLDFDQPNATATTTTGNCSKGSSSEAAADKTLKASERSLNSSGGSVKKGARKSLALDDVSINFTTPDEKPKPLHHHQQQQSNNKQQLQQRQVVSVVYGGGGSSQQQQSALVGDKTVVERRASVHGGGGGGGGKRQVFMTRRRRTYDVPTTFDKHWVQVACGRSLDQRAMTEAAKRCLTSLQSRRYVK